MPILIDGHLDLAMNALACERDQTATVEQIRQREAALSDRPRGTATTSLPELRGGEAAIVVATLIARCKPWVDPARSMLRTDLDYAYPSMAHAIAQAQLAYYRWLERRGEIRLITRRNELDEHLIDWANDGGGRQRIGVIVMMEGADPITDIAELPLWVEQGLRCLSLAHFGHSRFAAGTPSMDPNSKEQDGPLTPLGIALLKAMEPLGVVLDLTHTADRSFFQAVDIFSGPICATHANCRTLAPSARQLTDDQLKIIIERDGVIGMAMHYAMLRPHSEQLRAADVTLDHVAEHIEHICDLAGSSKHVAIGSDLDGGFGSEATPARIDRHCDLQRLADVLDRRNFTSEDIDRIFHGNWQRFYRRVLPD